jgi:hypothetical protein
MRRFVCIVEGHGEAEAVPVLVRRIAQELDPADPASVVSIFRVPRNRLVLAGELERRIEIAARRVQGKGAILILIDSDDDCPARLGPELQQRARAASSLPVAVVLAKREFEAWFLASAASLRGCRRLAKGPARSQHHKCSIMKTRLEKLNAISANKINHPMLLGQSP